MKKLFVTFLFAGFISFVPSFLHLPITCILSAQIPADGLVAWYPFNGNANDESGNGNHGTVNGATLTADRFGNGHSAYTFDGNDFVESSISALPVGNSPRSVTFWANQEGFSCCGSGNSANSVFHWGDNTVNNRFCCLYWPNKPVIIGESNDACEGCSGTTFLSNSIVNLSTWNQVTITFDGIISRCFINGIQCYFSEKSYNTLFSTLKIGKAMDYHWSGEFFIGKIDDIAIYNRALSSSEIQQLYQDQTGQVQQPLTCNITTPTTTLCAGESTTLTMNTTGGAGASSQLPANLQQGLVAYYPFNGNANDESGNGNNGVVNGATLTSDRFGNGGGAYSFNSNYLGHYSGNDYIRCVNPGPLGNSSRSVSFWVKTDSVSISQLNNIVFSYGSNETVSAQQFRITLAGSCDQSISAVSYSGNRDIPYVPSGNWEMITVVFDSGISPNCAGFKLYLNSIELQNYCSDFSGAAINTSSLNPITIGCYHDLNWTTDRGFFKGNLDDLMVYNRALTPSEIQQLYTAQSYAWSNNATTPTITVTPTESTTYSCTITQGNQTCTASVDITVNPNVTNTISATIIEGETYTLGAQTLTSAGTYAEVFTSAAGCDSTVTLTLSVEPLLTCEITAPTTTLCEGESVTLSVNTTGGPAASSQLPANLQQGLVAYYPFNGNANDESGNGNNGVVNGATLTSDRFGNVGKAYDFNGIDNYINCGTNNIFNPQDISISVWVYQNSIPISTPEQQTILGKTAFSSPEIGYRIITDFDSKNYFIWSPDDGNFDFTLTETDIQLYNWENIVAIKSGDTLRIYKNSFLENELVYHRSPLNNNNPFLIGAVRDIAFAYPHLVRFFNGKIDDITIYNRALSPSEIQQLYTAQSYAWSNNATTPTITVSPAENTTYICTVTQGNQTCTASVDITVNPNVTNAISASIIEGETYTLGTQTLTTAGTYTEVFTSSAGCDSTVTLTLTVEPLLTCEINAPTTSLCEGESVTLSVNTTGGAGASSQLPANLQQGLVAYYPFNGNANDESGNGNNGVVNGATLTADRFGNVGRAYGFDGFNDFIDFGNLNYISTGTQHEYSISLWINPSSLGNYPSNNIGSLILGDEIYQNNGVILSLSNVYGFNVYNSGPNIGACNCFPSLNEWINYSVVQTSAGIKFYINGIYWGLLSNILNVETDQPTRMGYFYQLQTRAFQGMIDDTFIYNRALSSSEIQQLYTSQSYVWSNNATTPTITVSPTQHTTYTATVTTATQTCTDSITITVNPLLTWYADIDGDGYGDSGNAQEACAQPQGFVSNANDCNDVEALAYTGAVDLCDNGIDEDCSGADSTCIVLGCTDINACNFNPTANTDDLSCTYPSQTYLNCDAACINDADGDGVCDEIEIAGCTDATAFNYNPQATNDDGSCEAVLICNVIAPVTDICVGESISISINSNEAEMGSSSVQSLSPINEGLTASYYFNDGSLSNASVVGSINAGTNRFGQPNGSYLLTNNGYINLGNGGLGSNPSSYSMSLWFKSNQLSLGLYDNTSVLITRRHMDWGPTWTTLQILNSGNLALVVDGPAYSNILNSNINVLDNTWHHVVGVKDGNNYSLYLDGNLVGSFVDGYNHAGSNQDFHLGHDGAWNTNFYGSLDDVNIFNRAVTGSEVQMLFGQNSSSVIWSNNATTPSITVTPTQTTTYTATVTTATQTCTDSITITVNPLLTWYADADADGFGNPDDVVQDCNQPQGYIADNSDCNDADASSYPNAEEICFDQIDNNCNGSTDENCAIFGCINPNACNFNPQANTDDGSCILPQPETCNGLDDNCNGQVDEGFSAAAINAVSAVTALYPVCSGNSIRSANLNNGANSAVIDGNGNDLWYSFTAQFNTFRAGLSAAFGDNDVRLYTMTPGGCLELIETEHENTAGNQTLLSDQLTVGQTYYVAVHNISGPMNTSAKICFNHLNASTCDHYYSNNTGIYTSVCNSFKAQYRANAVAYTFDILSATQNNVNQNITPWSYTTTSASTVVARLGTLLPANQGTSAMVFTLKVPVLYSLFDAAGNFENLFAQATTTCTVTLNAEQTVALRISDRCPTNKSLTSTIAPDRTVCGAMRYDWEFTQVLPTAGTAQVVQGGAYASAFFLSNVPGITAGKTYNVRVRPVHSSGIAGQWGSAQCLRVGAAGMIQQSESESENVFANTDSPIYGSTDSPLSLYPNPTSTGSFVLEYNDARRGELIFAQQSMTELVMMDITGKVVFKTNVVLNGNVAEINFGELESGLYLVDFGGERSRLQVVR